MAEEKQIWGGDRGDRGSVLFNKIGAAGPTEEALRGRGWRFFLHRSMKEGQDGVVLVGQSAKEQSSVRSNKLDL